MKSTDIIISGAGIPGLVLAILLAKSGLQITVCDPAPLPSLFKNLDTTEWVAHWGGRTSALMETSLSLLEKAGIEKDIVNHSEDLKILTLIDQHLRSDFNSEEIGRSRFGRNVQNFYLQGVAFRKFLSLKTGDFISSSVKKITQFQTHAEILFENGEQLKARLVIGADGRNSTVRKLAGIDIEQTDYGQTAITGLVSHTKPHENRSIEFHSPGGPFTLVPLPGPISSFVWMEKTQDAEKILKFSRSDIEQEMTMLSRGMLGEMSLLGEIKSQPVITQSANRLIGERTALMAEAAHVLSPIGAQGMNLSLRDAASLHSVIVHAARMGGDIGSNVVLREYESERQADILLRVRGVDLLNKSVASENSMIVELRRLGFKTASGFQPLRSFLMREGLSPADAY